MTDPFSVVAGVVGIVGVALSNTRQVYDFIVGIKGAPETVTTLSGDLDSLANILQQLSDLTQDPSQALFIVPLKGSLERCITALNQLELSIKPYVEGLRSGRSKWKRFAWNFKEKEVAALQVRLGSCKDNLQLAILLGVMTQQASSSNDIRANFQRLQQAADGDIWSVVGCDERSSDAQASEYGFALKRFLLEHEPELGSELGDNPILPTFNRQFSYNQQENPWSDRPEQQDLHERPLPPILRARNSGNAPHKPPTGKMSESLRAGGIDNVTTRSSSESTDSGNFWDDDDEDKVKAAPSSSATRWQQQDRQRDPTIGTHTTAPAVKRKPVASPPSAALEETIEDTAGVPSSGMFVTQREIDPSIGRESEIDELYTEQKQPCGAANHDPFSCFTCFPLHAEFPREPGEDWLNAMENAEKALETFEAAKNAAFEFGQQEIAQEVLDTSMTNLDRCRTALKE